MFHLTTLFSISVQYVCEQLPLFSSRVGQNMQIHQCDSLNAAHMPILKPAENKNVIKRFRVYICNLLMFRVLVRSKTVSLVYADSEEK